MNISVRPASCADQIKSAGCCRARRFCLLRLSNARKTLCPTRPLSCSPFLLSTAPGLAPAWTGCRLTARLMQLAAHALQLLAHNVPSSKCAQFDIAATTSQLPPSLPWRVIRYCYVDCFRLTGPPARASQQSALCCRWSKILSAQTVAQACCLTQRRLARSHASCRRQARPSVEATLVDEPERQCFDEALGMSPQDGSILPKLIGDRQDRH